MEINWIKPSEELPESGIYILFVARNDYVDDRIYGGYYDGEWFHANYGELLKFVKNDVIAWCVAPDLPDWVRHTMSEDDKKLCIRAIEIMQRSHIIANYTAEGMRFRVEHAEEWEESDEAD